MTSPSNSSARNAQLEAQEIAGRSVRVLEPSPPAVNTEPFFADDPVAVAEGEGNVVVPSGLAAADNADTIDWNQWLVDHPEHADWVADHWLGGPRRLPDVPASLVATRTALHRLATYVIAPVRHKANGKFGLRWTKGGFGTPFFDDDRQVRVEGTELVDQRGDETRRAAITSLRAAADFLESAIDPDTAAEHDSPPVGDVEAPLTVDPEAVAFLDSWYGMAYAALERLRADTSSIDASRPQLWPGHFDPAIEVGTDDTRASYGASPGDDGSDEPYLYASAWWPDRLNINPDDDIWNADGFVGRILKVGDFPAGDPVDVAVQFCAETRDILAV